MRRTYVQLIAAKLDEFPNQRASRARLMDELGWPQDKFDRALERALAEPNGHIQTGPGGVIKHLGSERFSSQGAGIYTDVTRVIRDHWGPKTFGMREIESHITARGGRRGDGEWTHPDLVIAAYPRRRANRTDPKELHAIEVETRSGFDIRSIYQAHAQARGADFAWVFTFTDSIDSGDRYDRIHWAAEEIGVGIVRFDRPGASGTYKSIIEAREIKRDYTQRSMFLNRVLGLSDDSPLLGDPRTPTARRR